MKAGWQTSTLGDVLAVIRNGVNCKQDKSGNGERISRIESISDATFDLDKVGYAELSERDKEKNRLLPGDILFSHINSAVHVGKTAVFASDEPVYHGVNLLLMRPKEVVTSAYLDHALKYLFQSGYWRGVCKQSVNQASVNQQDISRVEIRYPKSLAEQQRIVGLLDEAFEGLATAKANAEKNLQNARALFESHLQSVFTQRGPGWVEKTLGDVFTTATGTTPPKNNVDFYGDFMPLVKPPELCDEAFDSAPDGLSEAGAAVARTLPAKSILVSCIGNLGKIGLNIVPVAFNQQINAILPDETQAIPEFMFFQSLSPVFKSQLESLASGTTVPIVNKSKFNSVSVVLPPLPIQKPVVAQLSSLREETQRLARLYEQKLAALEALKKSLLHQAFTGAL
jgi:type I restriction enzyme S subunit